MRSTIKKKLSLKLAALGVALSDGMVFGGAAQADLTRSGALSHAATAFGEGDSQARILILWDDEMGELGRTFNDMAQSIAGREKGRLDFVAMVAHDLKSPLVVVGGAAELLENGEVSPEEQTRWLQTIRRNARALERIIADLTDRVQAQTGRLQLRRKVFDLSAMTAEIVQQLRRKQRRAASRFYGRNERFGEWRPRVWNACCSICYRTLASTARPAARSA